MNGTKLCNSVENVSELVGSMENVLELLKNFGGVSVQSKSV